MVVRVFNRLYKLLVILAKIKTEFARVHNGNLML